MAASTDQQIALVVLCKMTHFTIIDRFLRIQTSTHLCNLVSYQVKELAKQHNLTINGVFDFPEPYVPVSNGNPFPGIISRSYVDTRSKCST